MSQVKIRAPVGRCEHGKCLGKVNQKCLMNGRVSEAGCSSCTISLDEIGIRFEAFEQPVGSHRIGGGRRDDLVVLACRVLFSVLAGLSLEIGTGLLFKAFCEKRMTIAARTPAASINFLENAVLS